MKALLFCLVLLMSIDLMLFSKSKTFLKKATCVKDGDVVSIMSVPFVGAAIRLDGANCSNEGPCGNVNVQFTSLSYEKYTFKYNADGSVCFQSVPFKNVYLHADPSNCTNFQGSGCGKVTGYYNTNKNACETSAWLLAYKANHVALVWRDSPVNYLRCDGNAAVKANQKTGNGYDEVDMQFYTSIPAEGAWEYFDLVKAE